MAATNTFARLEGVGFSEPIGFLELVNDWRPGSFSGGEKAFAHAWAEVGYRTGDWTFSVSLREHAETRFSRDAAEFYYQIKNRLPLEANRLYKMELDYNQATLFALRSVFAKTSARFNFHYGANLLIGKDLTSGKIKGTIQPVSDRDYDFNKISLAYSYSKDLIFSTHQVNSPVGLGIGLEGGVSWYLNEKLELSAEVENVFSFIRWFNAPHTNATIDTDNKTTDADGFINVRPLVSGRHTKNSITQQLPLIVRLNSEWNFYKPFNQINHVFYNEMGTYMNIGLGYSASSGDYNILYEVNNQAYLLEWKHRYFHFAYLADDLNIKRQKHIEFKLILQVPF